MGETPSNTDCILPPELWTQEIAPHLTGLALLSMSQTCRALRSIFHCREVWRQALQQACLQHGVFLPSFPIDRMDLKQLKQAATGPERWDRLVENHAVLGPKLVTARTLAPVCRSQSWKTGTLRQKVVPGGRYMVTSHFDPSARTASVALWDLGLPGAPAQRAPERIDYRVYATHVPSNVGIEVEIHFGEAGEELKVLAVHTAPPPDDPFTAVVLSINPGRETRFRELGAIKIDTPGHRVDCAIRGNVVLFLLGGDDMILWRYRRGYFAKLKLAGMPAYLASKIMALTNGYVVCVFQGGTLTLSLTNGQLRYMQVPSEGVRISMSDVPVIRPDYSQPSFLRTDLEGGVVLFLHPPILLPVEGLNSFLIDATSVGVEGEIIRVDRHHLSVNTQGLESRRISSKLGFPSVLFPCGACGNVGTHISGKRAARSDADRTYAYYVIDETLAPQEDLHSARRLKTHQEAEHTPVKLVPILVNRPLALDVFSGRAICHDRMESRQVREVVAYCVDFL